MVDVVFQTSWSAPPVLLAHYWEHTVGSCHAPLALRADWQAQLARCRRELGFRRVRFHGLLCDDLGTCVSHKGWLLDSFYNADAIVDYLLSIDVRPFVELSFMPEALASGGDTVFHYRANVTPPRDPREWAGLVRRLAGHWRRRYGADEVRRWYFEVWNEPNLRSFWAGTRDDYLTLYRHTALALKDEDAGLQVGGPATAKNEWLTEFLDFCAAARVPADFVSTHHYPNDPLWSEEQDTEAELAGARRGALREWAAEARRQARGLPLLYTEWNASSNPRYPRQDDPYAAAFAVKSVLDVAWLVEAYAFWTFSDIFEENYFPSHPFHGGFGLLTLHGVPKPTYRAFELLHRLGDAQLPVDGTHETLDAWAVRGGDALTVLLTNHALPRQPIAARRARVEVAGVPAPRAVSICRIDEDHANAKAEWGRMGSPDYLRREDVGRLEDASRLREETQPWHYEGGVLSLEVSLPPHAVAALTVEFVPRGP
jgi:xylan 1,4-beta-xylosidase